MRSCGCCHCCGLASSQIAMISYPDPIVATVGDLISVSPSILVGNPIFSASSNLPTGFSLNATTFVLSGTVQPIVNTLQTVANLTFTDDLDSSRLCMFPFILLALHSCWISVHVPVRFNLFSRFPTSVYDRPVHVRFLRFVQSTPWSQG